MKIKLSCCLLLSLFSLSAFSQQLYDSLLNELNTRYPQEKIYMQLDKSFYNPGETIWFKAYLISGNRPFYISNTLYAELVNEKGTVLQRKVMPVLEAGAASHFDLKDSESSYKLYIRAYTSWMLNFDSSFLYLKPVNIIRPASAAKKLNDSLTYTLTLFPEGGDLVENIESRVAFKTNDNYGKPFDISGIIKDPKGITVGSFNSTHRGMGYFKIMLTAGEGYKALWKDPAGMQHETNLPKANSTGATLSISHVNGKLLYSIVRPVNATAELKEYIVVAQVNSQTVYAARINLNTKTAITAPIPTDSLPDGIIQITLFNKIQQPVAERIAFINNNSYFFMTDLHMVEKNISPRGKNLLQVDVGGRLKSNLSISVTDADLDTDNNSRENIFSQLMLTSDLKGYVYDPAYYFSSDEDSVKHQLDLVMMTNGWRRFKWEALLANQWPAIKYKPVDYLSVQGRIFGLTQSQLTDKTLTGMLQASDNSNVVFLTIPVDKDGNFKLDGVYFFDTVKLFYQLNNDKNKALTSRASFSFTSSLAKSPPMPATSFSNLFFSPGLPPTVLERRIQQNDLYLAQLKKQKIKLLENVTVKSKKISAVDKLEKEYASGLFSGGNSRIFAVEDDPFAQSSLSILDYLRGKVAGLQINTAGPDGGSITRRGSNTDVFLNEMNVDINLLQSTPMSDVAMIKVFDPPFFGSFGGGAGGAVAVYTKKGRSSNSSIKGLETTILHGYSSIKEFYTPNYEIDNNPAMIDYRSTLYWNPFLLMDATNKRITIPFYNNDTGKKIRVIIEGLNEEGKLTREEKYFE
ncbi:MAG: hypothetical protein ABIW38_12435 [Ferruginibacter sp.]